MIKYLTILLFFWTPLFSHDLATDISKKNKPVTVKVLLTTLADETLLEVRGRHLIYNPRNDELIYSATMRRRAPIMTHDVGLYWKEEIPGHFEIRIVPADKKCSILVNGIQYKGCVEIYSIGGTLNIVNEVDAESYLESILGSKFSNSLNREVLDALVIAERTNLYHLVQKDAFSSWQVEAEKVGYLGVTSNKQQQHVKAAVNRTRNMVLNYKKQPFATTWDLDHAGKSVPFTSIFRKNVSSPKGVNTLPSSLLREKSKWKVSISKNVLANLVHLPNVDHVDLFTAKESSKVYAARLYHENLYKDIDFFFMKSTLGLISNDFTVSSKGNKILFTGYGKGSGVGLCVKSAEILAKRGQKAGAILKAHYPETELVNMRLDAGKEPVHSHIWR